MPSIDSHIDKGGGSQQNGWQEHGRQPERQRGKASPGPVPVGAGENDGWSPDAEKRSDFSSPIEPNLG